MIKPNSEKIEWPKYHCSGLRLVVAAVLLVLSTLAVAEMDAINKTYSRLWGDTSKLEQKSTQGAWLKGYFVQGGLLLGQLDAEQLHSVSYRGRELPLFGDGLFLIGLDRDAPGHIELQLGKQGGEKLLWQVDIAPRAYAIQSIEGVKKKYVSPDPEQLKRSRRESALVAKARRSGGEKADFIAGFSWPAKGPLTGVFGSQRVYNGQPRRPHYGVDIAGPVGQPVFAPAAGLVTLAEPDLYFSGGTLIIDHGMGLSSTFLHLSRIHVSVGQRVDTGQPIADMGATGRVTGPHLDWRMNWTHDGNSVRIDPQLLVSGLPEQRQR